MESRSRPQSCGALESSSTVVVRDTGLLCSEPYYNSTEAKSQMCSTEYAVNIP
jgi:hypothetical protein